MIETSTSNVSGLPTINPRSFPDGSPRGGLGLATTKFAKANLYGKPSDLYAQGDMHRDHSYVDESVEAFCTSDL